MTSYLKLFRDVTEYNSFTNKPKHSHLVDEIKIIDKCSGLNNQEYIDLDLPSETLWATKNVLATNTTDFGQYFSWGSIDIHTDNPNFVYNGDKFELDSDNDVATVYMGGCWHTPTLEQLNELLDNTTYSWKTNYLNSGNNGILFTSKNNSEKIFFPASGFYSGTSFYYRNNRCGYWTKESSSGSSRPTFAYRLFFNKSDIYNLNGNITTSFSYYAGYNVRGVIEKNVI